MLYSQCIYCKKHKEISAYKSREHVIPQAFGKFTPNNLILNSKRKMLVCQDCNNHLSTIERWLAKDSYEGYVLRNRFEKPIDSPDRRRLHITIQEGEYLGAHLELTKEGKVTICKQIGLLNKNNNWDYYLLNEVKNIDKSKYTFSKNSFRSIGLSDDEINKTFSKIEIKIKIEGTFDLPKTDEILTKISFIVDSTTKRAIAKIAFNFLAYYNYKCILLNPTFDKIRNFIINNSTKSNLVKIIDEPIFLDELNSKKRRACHFISIVRDGNTLLGIVSLYNYFQYHVKLSNNNPHEIKLFTTIFNVDNKSITYIEPPVKPRLILPSTKLLTINNNLILPDYLAIKGK